MKNTIQFIKQNSIYIIVGLLLIVSFLFLFTSKVKNKAKTDKAVSESKIENLISDNEQLNQQIKGYKGLNLKAYDRIKELNNTLYLSEQKVSQIALKYEIKISNLKKLTGSESVELFLDKTEQPEFPVQKYSESPDSTYLIPLTSIQYANIAFYDLDEQKEINQELKTEITTYRLVNKELTGIIQNKDSEIKLLNKRSVNYESIITEKDKQIKAEHKKYVSQKVRTYLVGSIGAVAIIGCLIF